jgi:carbamoyltransferase
LNILGYAALNHDPCAAVVTDGVIRAALESEKVTRAKHEINAFPEEAMRAVLAIAGLEFSDIDVIATNYSAGPLANRLYLRHFLRLFQQRNFDLGVILGVGIIAGSHHKRMFNRLSERRLPKVVNIPHHRAHLASSFLLSPFEESAVMIVDAAGELECTSLWHCEGRKIRKLYSMDLPSNSLGSVYMLATRHLGYRMLGDEYKVMGLAPYGRPNPRYRRFFEQLVRLEPNGRYTVNSRLIGRVQDGGWKFPAETARIIGHERAPDDPMNDEHADFAYELQHRLEEAELHVARHLKQITGSKNLCLAGGVALNCVANGKLLTDSGFSEVFVPPAPHDAGTALGAALYHHFYTYKGERPAALEHPYLGPHFSDEFVERELIRAKVAYTRCDDIAAVAASGLASGLVIGWYQGATEFGPRSLGNRSILADPRKEETKELVNALIKEREGYRPFAPAMLEEAAGQYLKNVSRSPWMLFVDQVRDIARENIPAAVHVDGTTRPQTVSARDNALFHDLLSRFRDATGVPALLNTSFNVSGEPIVNTPIEAIRCFHGSGLDALAIGPFWLQKPHVGATPVKGAS